MITPASKDAASPTAPARSSACAPATLRRGVGRATRLTPRWGQPRRVDWRDIDGVVPYRQIGHTGPVDEFVERRLGALPYRSLDFEFETLPVAWVQPVGTVNHPNEHAYTRQTEFKHLTGQQHACTTVVREYPRADGDPYYPIPRPETRALYERYRALADATDGVHFVGRLATYRYYNMDQVVAQALTVAGRLAARVARPEAFHDGPASSPAA